MTQHAPYEIEISCISVLYTIFIYPFFDRIRVIVSYKVEIFIIPFLPLASYTIGLVEFEADLLPCLKIQSLPAAGRVE